MKVMNMANIQPSLRERWFAMQPKTRIIISIGAAVLVIALLFLLYSKGAEWWHQWTYTGNKTTADTKAQQSETAGDQKVGSADEIRKRLDKLQNDFTQLEQRTIDLETAKQNAHQESANTRTVYVERMRQPVRNRAAGDGVDDDTLRADSQRAEQAVDNRRNKATAAQKP